MSTPLNRLLSALPTARPSAGGNWSAKCPAHDDRVKSLSVKEGDDGRVLVHCHAGCDTAAIVAAVGLTLADLYDPATRRVPGHRTWRIPLPDGRTVEHERIDQNGGGKRFTWAVDGVPTLHGIPVDTVPLYGADRLNGATRVVITEGESACDALTAAIERAGISDLAVVATVTGASKIPSAAVLEVLRGRRGWLWPDNDPPGQKHMADLTEALKGMAAEIRVVRWAQAPDKGDAADWVALGGTAEELIQLLREARSDSESEPPPPPPPPALELISIRDLIARVDAAPRPSYLFREIWPADAYGVLAAAFKVGKSFAVCDRMISVSSGTAWFDSFPCDRAGHVLAFFGEGGERKVVRRLRAIAASRDLHLEDLPITVCTRAPHLRNRDHLAIIEEHLASHAPVVDVIIDPLYLAAPGVDKGDVYQMGEMLMTIQQLVQKAGSSLLAAHHFNRKEGTGAERMTGAGPAEWGRVLIAMISTGHRPMEIGGGEEARLKLEITGDEVPEMHVSLRRRVWVDDPNDLSSTMHYESSRLDDVQEEDHRPTYMMEMVSKALEVEVEPLSVRQVEKAVLGRAEAKRLALRCLVVEGFVSQIPGYRGAFDHSSIRPFRVAGDLAT